MNLNPLGQKTNYDPHYNPSLLFPIPRAINRQKNKIDPALFDGYDLWNGYELSWLSPSGKPEVRRIQLVYPASSDFMIESKSLKLYLGSFIMTIMQSENEVSRLISEDLSNALKTQVKVMLSSGADRYQYTQLPEKECIDQILCSCSIYHPDATLLQTTLSPTQETCHSHLLKTNCPITGQPDWATIQVSYQATRQLDKTSFLRYLVSYREHGDYHEACCEQIFQDLHQALQPAYLTVKCFYTRRGGIDINPCRFFGNQPDNLYSQHLWRQ